MFKIESYITPLILNYLTKYVKNIRPQDFQVSLWEGEVTFHNLDLRLDVLQQELDLPFQFLSGHIHELVISVPWTKITSEPIGISINTIEFVLKSNREDSSGTKSPTGSSSPQHQSTTEVTSASNRNNEREDTSSMGSSLATKILNNINVQCQNIILKYIEEDIVVSMNVQHLSYGPANEQWQLAMVDVNPNKVLMRKLINVSDLTICLDKRNDAGQIDVCQEPVMYRCTLECRVLRKYNSQTMANSSTTRIGVFTQNLDLNISTMQIPLLMRLIKFITQMVPEKSNASDASSTAPDDYGASDMASNKANSGGTYLSWAWNMLPSFNLVDEVKDESHIDDPAGHTKDIGIYVEELNLTLKNSEFINDAIMGGIKRIRYMPIVRFTIGGLYWERVMSKELEWSNMKMGISSIYVEPLGSYRTDDQTNSYAIIDTAPFTNIRSFIDKSLFDDQCMIADKGWGVTNYDDYMARITDDYLLYRSPIFAFDVINYRSTHTESQEGPSSTSGITNTTNEGKLMDLYRQYRVLAAGITFRYNQTFLQVKNVIKTIIDSYDSTAYSSNVVEKTETNTAIATNTQKVLIPTEHSNVTVGGEAVETDEARSHLAARTSGHLAEGSPKLHPPLVEDYDALMQGVPLCKYKIELKRMRLEVYAKTEPEPSLRIHRKLPNAVKNSLPYMLLYFDKVEGTLSTPLNPDKLVHTTCQLPDKPQELLNACYDNYDLNIKDFSMGLIAPSTDNLIRLLTIPKLQLNYGKLLQPHYWKTDEVPIKKLDLQCDIIKLQFTKRELIAGLQLFYSALNYEPQMVIKMVEVLNHSQVLADTMSLNTVLSKLMVKQRYYHSFGIWNVNLAALHSDVVIGRKTSQLRRYNVLNTQAKMHNNQNKWLELQLQYPNLSAQDEPLLSQTKSSKKDAKDHIEMAIGVWMEKFNLNVDKNLLEFLSFVTQEENKLATDFSTEIEIQTQNLQNPTVSASHVTSSAHSTSIVYQTNNTMPQIFGRKSSRNSSSLRKISQPEETIHFSSEKDERLELTVTDPIIIDIPDEIPPESDEEKIKKYFKLFNTIIIYIDIAQSQLDVSNTSLTTDNEDVLKKLYTRIKLPKILLKSTFAEYISRSSMRLKINPPLNAKTTFNWTIQFQELDINTIEDSNIMPVLKPWQTTLTVATTKRKQAVTINTDLDYTFKSQSRTSSPLTKPKSKNPKERSTKLVENSSVSSNSLKEIFSGSERSPPPSPKPSVRSKPATVDNSGNNEKFEEIICLNLHLDSSTIHLFGNNVKILQLHCGHLMSVLELLQKISSTPSTSLSSKRKSNTKTSQIPLMILTSSEENQHIKEFMDLDSNSDVSALPTNEKKSILNKISLFCQWTIAKVVAEVESAREQTHKSKLVVEFEDFLSTVDQGQDFTKYTSKIGNFSLNYYQKSDRYDWLQQEYLRMRMIAESNEHPFLNIILTKVSLKDFYKRIGVKRKGEVGRHISEILIVMQAMEIIVDLDRIQEFMEPLCVIMEKNQQNLESKNDKENIIIASELPLVHFESKGITCYFPLDNLKKQCTVLICKIDSINVTPNLQNPLQRKPLRPDVYGKAASMGILSIPGSIVEDRQYELTLKKLSAASGNWLEILTHMRNKAQNVHTNPAVEWNNPERKQSLKLNEIFKNFTLIATYAPNIVYNNILICGQAIEFNCATDFIASINTDQLNMFSCHLRRLQKISETVNQVCKLKPSPTAAANSKTQSDTTIFYSPESSHSTTVLRTIKSLNSLTKTTTVHPEIRRFSRLGSQTQFESIDEDSEPPPCKIDSGVVSQSSKRSLITKDILHSAKSSSTNIILEKLTEYPQNNHIQIKSLPRTVSFVAGVFLFKIFDSKCSDTETQVLFEVEEIEKPLISFTISQPSFMVTQNIYDSIINFSIFNLSVYLPTMNGLQTKLPTNLFPENIIDTMPGDLTSTGIPPSLFTYKAHMTKQKMREIDIELAKPLVITISERNVAEICRNLMIIYNALQVYTCVSLPYEGPLYRTSKIMLMKRNTLNADRLNIKCNNIALKLTDHQDYECKLVFSDLKINLKYLTRPEKCSAKYSLGALYLRTSKKVFVHPISLKGSMDFVTEPWNRLPLINAIIKFNVIQIDLGIYVILQLRQAVHDLNTILSYVREELLRFQRLHLHDQGENNEAKLKHLKPLKCPNVSTFIQNNKSFKREEFYQDDLRAGAFQFVELMSDSVLPLPYQIQIIKKDYGIICWRYPQPRKMCKIHIYPVPMAVENPIHIKCRMEYFSEVHECFLHYCDLWLSETNSKDIKLPEREVCATIWRVVIMQSLVSVNGECFDTSEEDEELHSIASMNIDEVLGKGRQDADFILHPKVLVGCMRVDTTFQSNCVPKVQLLLSCNLLKVKLLNQPDENADLPPLLKKFHLSKTTHISQAFLMLIMQNIKFHSTFYDKQKFNLNVAFNANVKCLDYGFLNMISLLEETTVQSYMEIDNKKNIINANFVFDRLQFNIGPAIIHTLLSSKNHWSECLDLDERRIRHALIPKCIIVNRTMTCLAFGQTGTHERIQLNLKECYLYSFRSDYHNQELTFYITDEETNTVDTSMSLHIPFKFESQHMEKFLRVGNKVITVKLRKLSSSQIFVLIKGQIELVSMVAHNLRLEFRHEGKAVEVAHKSLEYIIEKQGRNSFYHSVQQNSNISMRLKLADNNIRARTGDIPLRTNNKLPWLVKVPINSDEFISFWIRVLREDIPGLATENFNPQKILITIWPIFEISSMLSCAIQAKETTGKEAEIHLPGQGARHILDVPATHLTEHNIEFMYGFPLGTASAKSYTLKLKSLDWQKFFWYDEQKWSIENTLSILAKPLARNWPLNDEEELKVKRISESNHGIDVIYNTRVTREFACTLNLEVAPWGMFLNATGLQVRVCELGVQPKELMVNANGLEMLFNISQGFSIGIRNGSNWIQSLPIYLENAIVTQSKHFYTVTEGDYTDIVILRGDEVIKFLLTLKIENNRKIFKLSSKFAVVNHTKNRLCILPFAMDHKESIARKDVERLDNNTTKTVLRATPYKENSIGISLSQFYDINAQCAQRSVDSAFIYFVVIKHCADSEISIPIPLTLPFNRKCFSIQNGRESIALMVSLIEHDQVYYLTIFEDVAPAVLLNNQTDCPFIIAQTNAGENSKVSSTSPEYEGKHLEWHHVIPKQSKSYYTPPEWYSHFPDVETTLCNITLALFDDLSTKKSIKWSKPIRLDKTWKKFLHIPGHGDVKVIICDKHRVIRLNIYYISQQMEFSVKDLRSRLSTTEPKEPSPTADQTSSSSLLLPTAKNYQETSQQLNTEICQHFRNDCDTLRQDLKIRFFVKEINLSLHTDNTARQYMKREVIAIYADDLLIAYEDNEDERTMNIVIPNLQIDNQLFSTGKYDFPVILCAEELYEKNDYLPEPFYLETFYKILKDKNIMINIKLKLFEDEFKINSLNCKLSPVRAYIEDAYITDFLDALVECEPSNCAYKPKLEYERKILIENQVSIPKDVEAQAIYAAEPLQLRKFCIEPMSVLLSVHTSVRLYIALDHSPLSFSSYERSHLLTLPLKFGQSLGMHYLSGAIFGAGWVVGSLEILGSPSGLARSVTTGLKDFVSLPVQGLFRGPWGFIVGVTQGSASLLRNVTAGTVNSVTKLAASVARNLDRLTLDEEHIERTEALRRSRPQGFTEGFSQGMTGLGISILGAVGGLAHHTLEARSPVEVFTGLSKGLVGAFTKPISGAAELLALAGQGMLQTVGFNAMPKQRCPSTCRNLATEPSGYRIWKLLPVELSSDQILFYHEITLSVEDQLKRGYVFLTSAVFAITEAEWDKLQFAFPVDKVEITVDNQDKTLYYVHLKHEREDIEEDVSYTNERIMNFLHTSSIKMTSDSLYDLLQTGGSLASGGYRRQQTLDWSFYISEHLGEHIMRYFKILNSNIIKN
ncbi:vacuolar protein sorting-associated protein 13B [Lucilia cuprina]|uniref:vacuolar protein sorting-associated protein 13B n=1 Tax=Lucilia cuprina TaxID=7375 RepID=UPI001F05D692|nr:vacuolar protein sorting-associated protein 13B [Lucilia cuprina]